MAKAIMPAFLKGNRSWPAASHPVLAGQTYISGAAVVLDADGKITEVATDPAAIKGFAANPAFSGPGRSLADTVIAVTPPSGEPYDAGQLYEASEDTVFSGQMYSGTTLVTPLQAMVNDNYGITRLSGGIWTLDQLKTGATQQRVVITRIDTDLSLVFFKVLSTYIQP